MGDFGSRLQEFRKYIKKSQKEFSECCGLSQANITHYETNKSQPTNLNFRKIEKAFPDLNMVWLIEGTGNMINIPNNINLNFNQLKDQYLETSIELKICKERLNSALKHIDFLEEKIERITKLNIS